MCSQGKAITPDALDHFLDQDLMLGNHLEPMMTELSTEAAALPAPTPLPLDPDEVSNSWDLTEGTR